MTDFLLLESGDKLLLESGDGILLENDEFSVADYNVWLADGEAERLMLLNIGNSNAAEYISSGEYQTESDDALVDIAYEPFIIGAPSFSISVPFLGEESRGELAISGLSIINKDGRYNAWRGYIFIDYEIEILLGDPSWRYSRFQLRARKFIIDDISFGDGQIDIVLRDKLGELDGPLQGDVISSGPNLDEPVPLAWGKLHNIPLTLLDPNTSGGEYQIHDGEIQAVDTLYDNGVTLTVSSDFTQDLSTGEVTKVVRPVGSITADVQGAKVGGSHLVKAADIVEDMVITHGPYTSADLDASSFTALNTAAAQTLGYFAGARINRLEAMSAVLTSVGAVYYLTPDNTLAVGQIVDPSGETSILSFGGDGEPPIISLSIRPLGVPQWRTRLGYQQNWYVQNGDDLAGSITDPSAPDKDRVAFLSKEYRVTSYPSGATASAGHIDPAVRNTHIDSKADADTEAQRIDSILGRLCQEVNLSVGAQGFQLRPLDIITVTDEEAELSAQKIQILEIEYQELDNQVNIRGWF